MSVGILTLTLHLPDSHSLKDKRRIIQPIIARLRKEFNISLIESGHVDMWQSFEMTIVCAANSGPKAEKTLFQIIAYLESHWPDTPVTGENIEILI